MRVLVCVRVLACVMIPAVAAHASTTAARVAARQAPRRQAGRACRRMWRLRTCESDEAAGAVSGHHLLAALVVRACLLDHSRRASLSGECASACISGLCGRDMRQRCPLCAISQGRLVDGGGA